MAETERPEALAARAGEGEGEGGKTGGKAATALNDRRASVASTAAPHGRSSSLLLQQTGSLESIPEVSGGEASGMDLRDMDALLSELGEREIESCCRLSIEDRPEKTAELTERAFTTHSLELWIDEGIDDDAKAPQQPPKATPTPARILPPSRRSKEDDDINYNTYPREWKTWWQRLRRALRVGCASCGARKPPRPQLPAAKVRQQVQTTDRCTHLLKTPW
ncbi:unnamed protein product [Vitrella brassicaformis CCMP3155]|uniref:Uncharacterized protein n=1 Tax=Vitrella brassicaformis (strain CCMP3155) TaxID=1169540 RepID=A0A0G4EX68_VITBC|nr:unnamed protein product [Vitrella brassicaformis CCMP3155]|eukprot:CEM02689.1 unnamed protein product [Vitrella brassicaformis CCMP3155]